MMRLTLLIACIAISACSVTKEQDVLNSESVKKQQEIYKQIREENVKHAIDDENVRIFEDTADALNAGSYNPKNNIQLRTMPEVAIWYVYPYVDEMNNKVDGHYVSTMLERSIWISDHGAVPESTRDRKRKSASYYWIDEKQIEGSSDTTTPAEPLPAGE